MKRSYHTDICIQYKLGMLDNELARQIPSSTLHNWKLRDFNNLFGTDQVEFSDEKIQLIKTFVSAKKRFKVIRALFRIHNTVQHLFNQIKDKSRILRQSKKQIVDTVENVKQSGLNRAVVLLGISVQQFYAWKQKLLCPKENIFVCNKRFPQQISMAEVKHIKQYLKLPRFLH